ncbi:MAG TPA: tail fiber protein [Prolixibacteraceae bacterium]|nr:tail fiber protein [Prolixibacteraceae bacterium]
MSEPFLAEIRIVGFNFAPRGWAFCDGQILPINQNQSLFSLLGTTYGGDGRTTFALPDLRGRTPVHEGSSNPSTFSLGQKGGEETHTLLVNEMPLHSHSVQIKDDDGTNSPQANNSIANSKFETRYTNGTADKDMHTSSVQPKGGGQAHNNMQPTLVLNYCIALQGLFPSRN